MHSIKFAKNIVIRYLHPMKKSKKVNKKTSKTSTVKPQKSGDVLVNVRLLDLAKQELKSEITSLRLETKAGFADVNTKLTQMMALMEEQNVRNKVVLDGYTQIYDKMEITDSRVEAIESDLFGNKQK